MLADLAMVDLHTVAFTPLNDLREQLVYCEDGRDVVLTMVAGRVVAEHGHVTLVDEAALLDEAREAFAAKAPALRAARADANKLFPAYHRIVRRAAEADAASAAGWRHDEPRRLCLHTASYPRCGQLARTARGWLWWSASASSPTGSATATPRTCCPMCPPRIW